MNFDDLKLILVPTDFSGSSEIALRAAIRLAQIFHAAIEIFHVEIDPTLMLPPPADTISFPIRFETVLANTAERLEGVVAEVRKTGVNCTSATEFGRSHAAIVERARLANAGLIVLGSHGRHGLARALLGSVAEKVVQHAPCAVLVVPVSSPA
ncbi:MAG TPA: universal stress protein [Polyangia bacterium]|nr:universal stress protein [Polyangia bacterium]